MTLFSVGSVVILIRGRLLPIMVVPREVILTFECYLMVSKSLLRLLRS